MALLHLGSDFASVSIAYLGDTLFLLFLLSGPLLKLAQTSRFAVYLICSKCISTVLDLPISVVNQKFPLPYLQPILTITVRFHVLALALNRAHSVLAPFHYSIKATKRLILLQCLCTWTISLSIGLVALTIDLANGTVGNSGTLYHVRETCNLVVACIAIGIYVAMSAKLIYSKLISQRCEQPQSSAITTISSYRRVEKDQMRIFMVCLISVIPFLFTYIRNAANSPDWLENAMWLIGTISDRLSFVAEELCLLAISAEFRQLTKQHCLRCISAMSCGTICSQNGKEGMMTISQSQKNNNHSTLQKNAIASSAGGIINVLPSPIKIPPI